MEFKPNLFFAAALTICAAFALPAVGAAAANSPAGPVGPVAPKSPSAPSAPTSSAEPAETTPSPTQENRLQIIFSDVASGDDCYEDVMFVYGRGMMEATSEDTFSPEDATLRGEFVQALYVNEGKPEAGKCPFTDVPEDCEYESGIAWAAEHKIVYGYGNDIFGPYDNITREQSAAILFRSAVAKGRISGEIPALTEKFIDLAHVSDYADEAISWCMANGVLREATETTLEPQGEVTRADAAGLLHRYCLHIEK